MMRSSAIISQSKLVYFLPIVITAFASVSAGMLINRRYVRLFMPMTMSFQCYQILLIKSIYYYRYIDTRVYFSFFLLLCWLCITLSIIFYCLCVSVCVWQLLAWVFLIIKENIIALYTIGAVCDCKLAI